MNDSQLHAENSCFEIREIESGKESYMKLLLIGDESEKMIMRYLGRGRMWAGFLNGEPVAVCVATVESPRVIEVKNLAVTADSRRKGLGRKMLLHVESVFPGKSFQLGTGETPSTLHFYHSCGYRYSHRLPDFFLLNYPFPIIEEGVELRDMVYLVKSPELLGTALSDPQ